MSDDSVQTFANHTRWLLPWHFVAMPVLSANAAIELVALFRAPSLATSWEALVAVALVVALLCARWMSLRTQDRVIRLEETLRLGRLLPERSADIEGLTLAQVIGLRFASDAEVAHLVDRIMAGELADPKEVKRAVQHWRPDHLRV